MLKSCGIALLLLFSISSSLAQEPKTVTPDASTAQAVAPDTSVVPADAKNVVNPVKPTAESLAQGKKYYGYDCAMCHGKNGDGKGDVDNGGKIPDFTDPASLKGKTDGELFYVLKTGHGHMPAERVRISQNELWNLINYVRSLAK